MNKKIFFVIPLVLTSLFIGIFGGLFRMGWMLPISKAAGDHGALMVGSFLGTLICLERIVTLKKTWLYGIPVLSGLSLPAFYAGHEAVAYGMLAVASVGLVYVYLLLISRFNEHYYYIMLVGAVGWLMGNVFLLKGTIYPVAVPWWILFILFTVVAERLELGKFLPQSKLKKTLLILSLALFLLGLFLNFHGLGKYVSGVGLIAIAAWLYRYDIARKSVKAQGMHRYTGSLLLLGYCWLAVAGILMIAAPSAPLTYDAILHSFFIGFTFSMIFAHGPIIFPGVAGLPIKPFHPTLFIWGILLQVTLISRITADLLEATDLRKLSGMANGIVIVCFFINLLILVKRGEWALKKAKKI